MFLKLSKIIANSFYGSLSIKRTIVLLDFLDGVLDASGQQKPHAWKLRTAMEGQLNEIFENIGVFYRTITSRLQAGMFRVRIF